MYFEFVILEARRYSNIFYRQTRGFIHPLVVLGWCFNYHMFKVDFDIRVNNILLSEN